MSYSKAYSIRSWAGMEAWMTEDMTMFGTAVDETGFGGDQTRRLLSREFQQAPMPVTSRIVESEVYELCEEIALIMLTMDICMHSRGLEIDCPDHRASIIMQKTKDGWKLAHGHWSQPDKDIDVGESVPYRLLIERSDQLEKKVAERTSKIESQKRELKATSDTKDKLFSIIAHDLKNPFNSILGFSAMLYENLEAFEPEKIKQILKAIHQQASATFDLLENLLDWAKSQTDMIVFRPRDLNLHTLVYEVLSHFNLVAGNKEINIELKVDDSTMVHADRHMLQIILRNLISNAIKFTHHGGHVTILATKENNHVKISVSDNGVGIPDNLKSQLLGGLTSDVRQGTANETGTGLGLFLCNEFVKRHGGKIWIESEMGQGSTFHLTIPAGDEVIQ